MALDVSVDQRKLALDEQLLQYLQRLFDDDGIRYRVEPRSITHGAEAATVELDLSGTAFKSRGLVLRMFRAVDAGRQARVEALVQNTLADAGFPAARVVDVGVDGVLERPFILMERLDGLPLLARLGSLGGDGGFRIPSVTTLLREASTVPVVPRLLTQLQHRLHDVDAQLLVLRLQEAGFVEDVYTVDIHLRTIAQAAEEFGLEWLAQVSQWLRERRPFELRRVICHGDMQPLNVLARRYRLSGVVDWSFTTFAEPELDFGFSNAAFATAPVDGPRAIRPFLEHAQRQFASRYLRSARRQGQLDMKRVEYYQVLRCALAISAVARRRRGYDDRDGIWDNEIGMRSLHEYVASVTSARAAALDAAGDR
jgi:aminoglycoside phosphotransferase (APT) family kinase protein